MCVFFFYKQQFVFVAVMATMMMVVVVTTVAIGWIHSNTAVLNIAGVVSRVPV